MEITNRPTEIDFMGKIRAAMIFSVILILAGMVSIGMHGGLNFGIDFSGGTLVQLQFKAAPDIDDIRDGLKSINLGESTIQEFGSKNDILIRVQRSEEKLEEVGHQVREKFKGQVQP